MLTISHICHFRCCGVVQLSFEELSGPQQALSQPGALHMWVKAAHGVKGAAKVRYNPLPMF
jgi:hypothetical protein